MAEAEVQKKTTTTTGSKVIKAAFLYQKKQGKGKKRKRTIQGLRQSERQHISVF